MLLEKRIDDQEYLVHNRLNTYLVTESPVWEYFHTKSLISTIDATHSIEVVSSDIYQIISDSLLRDEK